MVKTLKMRHAVAEDHEAIAILNALGWKSGCKGVISDAYSESFDGNPS